MPLLSFSAALTGDGGENDFSFCSDALLPRITRRCRLLAAAVSLACVTCAQRRVSDNNFVCVCVYKCPRVCPCVCVCARCHWRICHPCWLSRGSQRSRCSGFTLKLMLCSFLFHFFFFIFEEPAGQRARVVVVVVGGCQIKDDILNTCFNYSAESRWSSQWQLPAAGSGRSLRSAGFQCCISADLTFFLSFFLNSKESS